MLKMPDSLVIPIYPALNPEDQFQQLYDVYYGEVKKYVSRQLRTCSRPEESIQADDITQDIFLKLWIGRKKILTISLPESYLFKMAKNRIFDLHRLQIRKKKSFSDPAFPSATPANLTEQDFFFRETKRILNVAIYYLPPRTKEMFLLRQGGLKMAEISARTGITKRTVTNHLLVAGKKLEKSLGA